MPHERVRALRERVVERKEQARAKREAAAERRQQFEERLRERARESAPGRLVRGVESKAEAAREEAALTAEEVGLLANELGISRSQAQAVAERASATIERAQAAGDIASLDVDGDGDTDLLESLEEDVLSAGAGQMGGGDPLGEDFVEPVDPAEPVVDFEGELTEPLFQDIDVEEPLTER